MATDKQVAANRANSKLSTGPTSDAGRAAVSENSTKHGLTGEFKPRNEAEVTEARYLFDKLTDEYHVTTATEIELIAKMVQALIRSNRAALLQDDCIAQMEDDPYDQQARKDLELYLRYQASYDRAYQRYAAELRKFQAEKKKAEIGFVSQKREEAKEARAQAREQRRENEENRKAERHTMHMAIAKEHLEREKATTFLKAAAVAKQLDGIIPPEMLKDAA